MSHGTVSRTRIWKRYAGALFAVWMLFMGGATVANAAQNIILLIGDGMGAEHIRAASLYAHGKEGALFMEGLPYQALVETRPAREDDRVTITDSAASATAMATGHKVYNGVISTALPGDGRPLTTVLEHWAAAGKRTGLVTTSYLTDATPAAFAAHTDKRALSSDIARDYLERSRPNLLMGGADKGKNVSLTPEAGTLAGYTVFTNRAEMRTLAGLEVSHVLGLFSRGVMCPEYDYAQKKRADYDTQPHLSEMALAALEWLTRGSQGFFLMIEGACIDKHSHVNDLARMIYETLEFDRTVKVAVEWAERHPETLILVVADHETGGLHVISGKGKGALPEVSWASHGHSDADVRLFAIGVGAAVVNGRLDNTDIYRLMTAENK